MESANEEFRELTLLENIENDPDVTNPRHQTAGRSSWHGPASQT
jgi:hypothetical protein